MTLPRRLAVALSTSIIGAAGCVEAEPGAVNDPVERALALLDVPWCQPFAEHVCAAAERCGCTTSPAWPADCHTIAFAQCQRDLRRAVSDFDDGFLVSRDGVPACLATLDAAFARCEMPDAIQLAAECRVLVPRSGETLTGAGDRCPATRICAPGLRCAVDDHCRVPRPEGDVCRADGDCVFPLRCSSAGCSPGAGCAARCVPPPAPTDLGTACGGDSGAFCEVGAMCHVELRRRCLPLPEGRCAADHDCPTDSFCADFGAGPTCTPLPREGELCRDTPRCASGLACDFTSLTCVVPPDIGEPCVGRENGGPGCQTGLVCRGGTCSPPGSEGDGCALGARQCRDDLGCIPSPGGEARCAAFTALGEPCLHDEMCAPDAFCDLFDGTCAARARDGEACSVAPCAPGLDCVEPFSGERTCGRVAGLDDTCASTCPPGLQCTIPSMQSVCVPLMCGLLR